ncbi:melanocyte proliferating protein, putative (macronuclear) [Tetrahymena thermophila SB210]|uniref:Melanocyte proliferating protein, putative n=1 Tax=Tetrahymena thermophila (strain SB210) TaxID=312017 RepID=Q22EH5_TETTS|nr:melanocyte proliferating protein, putative [Tetrahymena thermophila SB210]EAR83677.1 melanocyte proliferating protein, putative [Tetrahymena thermophila SB210]|eukprot:XP_001031340.1 melanocyte proliferating protein, putative [Tetrahymena thermophila SB210]
MAEVALKKIGTHSGVFHCDEVLACVMLSKYTSEFKDGIITRTREQEILDQQNIIVDVGGIYDPSKHRYDHHQRSFVDTFSSQHNIRLSSAGLVYKHFGQEIIKNVAQSLIDENKDNLNIEITLNQETLDSLYQRIYDGFIQGVDGSDNGVEQYPVEVKSAYSNPTQLQQRIGRLNPLWTEKNTDENVRFRSAMEIADMELRWQVKIQLLSVLPAYDIVKQSVLNRFNVHPSGEIVILETVVPWKSHLEDLEKSLNLGKQIKFVLFPESSAKKAWRVSTVPENWGTYDLRIGLKEEWRGIKDMTELKNVTKIDDIVFVHNSGFIGGAKSYESVLRMALESIEAHNAKLNNKQ